jgi:glycosyltransferase involved in cell wall biosynthesis
MSHPVAVVRLPRPAAQLPPSPPQHSLVPVAPPAPAAAVPASAAVPATAAVLPAGAPAPAATPVARPAAARPSQVLIVTPNRSLTFVEQDVATLSLAFGAEVLSRHQLSSRRRLLPALARRLATRRFGLVLVWFADPYDTPEILRLARLFGVPSAVVVGGYELASLPALGYGALRERRGRRRVELALARADLLLPTSELLAGEIRALGGGERSGRSERVPGGEPAERAPIGGPRDPGERLRVIPPGIDCELFRPAPAAGGGPRERLVVTVATIAEATWKVKGLDLFAACARMVLDTRFAILGPCQDAALAERLLQLAGGNLEIPGTRLGPAELCGWYRRAAVYAQLSRRESFGVALAEAMACECHPVVADCGALPAVVGGSGWVVAAGRAGEAALGIAEALAAGGPCVAARRRIEGRYGAARRAAALTAAVRGLIETRGRRLPAGTTA